MVTEQDVCHSLLIGWLSALEYLACKHTDSDSAIELTKCVQMASHWGLQKDLGCSGLLSMDPSIP